MLSLGKGKRTVSHPSAEASTHQPLVVVYPGTFDPVHLGHLDIARRAASLADEVIVAVYDNPNKQLAFSTEERVALWQEVIAAEGLANIRAEPFSGLIVEHARKRGAQAIVRGLRGVTDFEYEFQQAHMNRKLAESIETLMIITSVQYLYVSASLLKEVVRLGGDLSDLVPAPVVPALAKRFPKG